MEAIYAEINAFRADPIPYHPACKVSPFPLSELDISTNLEYASQWHTEHVCDPVDHATCPELCHLFRSCRASDRIRELAKPAETSEEAELLVKGPKRPLKHLISSPGHCAHLLSPNINAMGGFIAGNLFILALAWINSTIS